MFVPRGHMVEYAAAVKRAVNVPVIAVGRLDDPELAAKVVADGDADLVLLGRALIAEPDWPIKVEEGRFNELRPCIACNACVDLVGRGERARCSVNPEAGRELEWKVVPAASRPPRDGDRLRPGRHGGRAHRPHPRARRLDLGARRAARRQARGRRPGAEQARGAALPRPPVEPARRARRRHPPELGGHARGRHRRGARRRHRGDRRRADRPADPGDRRRDRARRPAAAARRRLRRPRRARRRDRRQRHRLRDRRAPDRRGRRGDDHRDAPGRRASASRRSPVATSSASSSAAACRCSPAPR